MQSLYLMHDFIKFVIMDSWRLAQFEITSTFDIDIFGMNF